MSLVIIPPALIALSLAFAPAPPPSADLRDDEYQKKADNAVWRAPGKEEFKDCLSRYKGAYKIDFSAGKFGTWYGKVRVRDGDKEVYSREGHLGTAFIVRGHVLYHADFSSHSTGCAVVAYDLKARKQLWRAKLKGLGPISHFRYFNSVRLEAVDGKALAVYGQESAGQYVEFVSLKSGKTVGHKKFAK
jgi:hypothetical protein